MNIANALRAIVDVEPAGDVPTGDYGKGWKDAHAKLCGYARAALAAHDAAVSAGGWTAKREDANHWCIYDATGMLVARRMLGNAERIVACVNACQGIADPSRLVPALSQCFGTLISSSDPRQRQFARNVQEALT